MLIKGIEKGDKALRHFTFDDEDYVVRGGIYYYKVNYGKNKLEGEYAEDEIGYVACDKVMALGGRKPRPIPGREVPTAQKTNQKEIVYGPSNITDTTPTVDKPKRGRPAKTTKKSVTADYIPDSEQPGTSTFEYFVTEIKVDDTASLQDKLNTAGAEGWEMCGFDTNKSLFGAIHIVAIFKRKRG